MGAVFIILGLFLFRLSLEAMRDSFCFGVLIAIACAVFVVSGIGLILMVA